MGGIRRCVRNRGILRRVWSRVTNVSRTTQSDAVPVGDVYYGDCAENYITRRLQKDYWHLEQDVVEKLVNELPEGVRILDVPFGTGRFVPFYRRKNLDVYGLDASADMIRIAEQELREDFANCTISVGDAADLPYEDGFFHVIVCFRFLSHIVSLTDARRILSELTRVCRRELLLQFRVRHDDAPAAPWPAEDEAMSDRLNQRQITEILRLAGLRIRKTVDLEQREVYGRSVFVCEKS